MCSEIPKILKVFCLHIKEDIYFILFLSAFVFYLHHQTSIFKPFDYAVLHLNTAIAKQVDISKQEKQFYRGPFIWQELADHDKKNPVLLTYDQAVFDSEFKGIHPLDRCILNNHLNDILKLNPAVVAIDFDLSPLKYPNAEYQKCQTLLDNTLDHFGPKLILIQPVHNRNVSTENYLDQWVEERKSNGVMFASPKLQGALGIITDRSPYNNSLGISVASKMEPSHHFHINEFKNEHVNPINFIQAGNFKNIGSDTGLDLHDRPVFLGGTFGIDDYYLTPINENVPGAMIHAYDYYSILHPIETHGKAGIYALLADIMFALVVGFLMKIVWGKYLSSVRHDDTNSKAFFLFPIIILLPLIGFALAGIYLSVLFLKYNVWISPIPILIAVFLDGLISQLMEQVSEKRNEYEVAEKHNESTTTSKASFLYYLKQLIMSGTIFYTGYLIFKGFSHH